MKINFQSDKYQMMKLKKIFLLKKKVKLVIPVNKPMNFLKFNNMFF
jgi:hypothetical protein